MGTRSAIGFAEFDGSIRAIYCYYDGNVEHNGKLLTEYYNTIEAVEELLDMGDVVALDNDLELTKFFGRDNESTNAAVRDFIDVAEFYEYMQNLGCEYFFIFDGIDWLVADRTGDFKPMSLVVSG